MSDHENYEQRIRAACTFKDDTYYLNYRQYFNFLIQVHSVVETLKDCLVLRGWRARRPGPANKISSREPFLFRADQQNFKCYVVEPKPQIGRAIQHFGREYLFEIVVYDEHRDSLIGLQSGDFVAVENVHYYTQADSCSLTIHGKGADHSRGISKIPEDFDYAPFQNFKEEVEDALSAFSDDDGFMEFRTPEQLLEVEIRGVFSKTKFAPPCEKIEIGENIVVDNFESSSNAKFHFLTNANFANGLDKTWTKTIYCSRETARILPYFMGYTEQDSLPRGLICSLESNTPIRLDGFKVTLIDARHCVGSVMFVFEGEVINNGPVLCTGAFRADSMLLESLLKYRLTEKTFSKVFFDNTNLAINDLLPSRFQSFEKIKRVLDLHEENNVYIPMDRLGRELLLVDIHKHLAERILVYEEKRKITDAFKLFFNRGHSENNRTVEVVDKATWTISDATRENSVVIDLDASSESSETEGDVIIRRIPFSDHSSRDEILRFLSKLKFEKLYPTADKFSQYDCKLMMIAGKSDAALGHGFVDEDLGQNNIKKQSNSQSQGSSAILGDVIVIEDDSADEEPTIYQEYHENSDDGEPPRKRARYSFD